MLARLGGDNFSVESYLQNRFHTDITVFGTEFLEPFSLVCLSVMGVSLLNTYHDFTTRTVQYSSLDSYANNFKTTAYYTLLPASLCIV